jgi:hypothetical protein
MTMRISLGLPLLLAACASGPKHPAHPPEDGDADFRPADSRPAAPTRGRERAVRIVAKDPPESQYTFVGKVDGVADVSDWVEASKRARSDLQRKAVALGADVVKIDRIVVPEEGARGRLVLMSGRAFRVANDD